MQDNQIKILQLNMCGNEQKDKELDKKQTNLNNRVVFLISQINEKKPQIVFLSEVSCDILKNVESKILNYDIIKPINGLKGDYKAASIILLRKEKNVSFLNRERKGISCDMRYIEGTLVYKQVNFEVFFAYVPQAKGNERLEQKAEMLFGMYLFWNENRNKFTFVGGDLNTDLTDDKGKCKAIFQPLYDEMYDTVVEEDKTTWDKKRLDYALISKPLKDTYTCKTIYIEKNDNFDHRGLLTTIDLSAIEVNKKVNQMLYTPLTKKAMKIAFEVHKDQMDKNGIPYIYHPMHLAEQMTDENAVCTALLHDVVEDGEITFEQLEAQGFGTEIIEALKLLTHEKGVPYMEYIEKIKYNSLATVVKLADLEHNSDLTRLDVIDEKALKRAEKYKKAIEFLKADK